MNMKYKTVVIDPPWPMQVGKAPNCLGPERTSRKPIFRWTSLTNSFDYDEMNLEEIAAFPIEDFAHNESLLFLWVTNKFLRYGFDLLEVWGFKFHILITWAKSQGFAFWSPIRNQTEHVLFGWRGNFHDLVGSKRGIMKNHLQTNYQLKHSEKPTKFYQMLRAWTPEPRIDLFARRAHVGFDGWGDEYAGDYGPLLPFLEEEVTE